jgi:hypothetical protein
MVLILVEQIVDFMRLYWAAGILIVLGAIVAAAPWTFAPVCELQNMWVQTASGKLLPMPCGYTARAELGVGSMIVFSGVAMLMVKTAATRRAAGAFAGALGALAIAFPTYLTGMCAVASHPCRTATEPTLILSGLATLAVGAGLVLMRQK